jgi:hypothetical protein
MSKQTAVEWLIEKMHKNIEWIPVSMQEQAKEMEKEQITEAFEDGNEQGFLCKEGIEYYNETYKKEEK